MVQSRMMYCILTWGFDYYRIEKLQKRFVRIISSSKYNAHSEPLFKILDILKIEHLFSQSCLKFVYKFKKCQLPKYFSSLQCVPRSSIHDHDTRSASSIDTIYTRTHMTTKCIRSQLPLLSNNTLDIIFSKINTHSIVSRFSLSDIIYHNIWLSAKKGNVLYVTINLNNLLNIPPILYYVIVSRHVVNVMISTHHFSSSFHKFILSPPLLRFLPYPGPGKFWTTVASPLRETHYSGFCLNGLPSTQLLFVCIKLFDFVTFFPIIYLPYIIWRCEFVLWKCPIPLHMNSNLMFEL